MLLRDIFANRKQPVLSFEIFPPKKNSPIETIYTTIEKLQHLNPDFISVTYGAGGSNKDRTVEIASLIKNKYKIESLAHLTCIASTKTEIENILSELKKNNIKNILALRGDLPQDKSFKFPTPLHYHYAQDLITQIHKENFFSISAACYPEGHLTATSLAQDIEYLKQKVDTGVDLLLTQLFFDNNYLYDFMDKIRQVGINVPVVAGIMPLFNQRQIKHCLTLSKITLPAKFTRILEKYGDQPAILQEAGLAYATDQIIDLLTWDIAGIHIYSMNRPQAVEQIVHNISTFRNLISQPAQALNPKHQ